LTLVERKDVQPIIIDTILLSKPWYVEQLKMRKAIVITYNKTIPFYYESKNEPKKVVNELVNNIIDNNIQNKSIYSTIFYYDQKQLDIPQKYYITPKDHLFKIESQKSEAIELNLSYRYLFDKAVPYMDRSRILISDMCTFLAIYYLNKEQNNAAIDKFKQAIALNNKSFVAHADLAFLYFKQNDINNALIEFKKAYQIDPKNEEIFEAIRWIEEENKFGSFGPEK
jgi:tetratricopeptide (TPR) repeat protein